MESHVEEMSVGHGPLQPSKHAFEELVKECHALNKYAAHSATAAGKAYEEREVGKSIEVLHQQGVKAFDGYDQKTYTDSINGLQTIHEHAQRVIQDSESGEDNRTD